MTGLQSLVMLRQRERWGYYLTDSTTPLDPPELHCVNSHIIGNRAAQGNGGGIYVDKRMKAIIADSVVHGNFYGKLWTKSDVDKSFFVSPLANSVQFRARAKFWDFGTESFFFNAASSSGIMEYSAGKCETLSMAVVYMLGVLPRFI